MAKRKHIDDVQPSTVDEHFKLLLEDQTVIEKEFYRITKNDLPEWFDEELFKAGQAFYMKNVLSVGIAQVTGLLSILCVPGIWEVLIFTKHSENSCLTFKRYAQTLLLVYQLFYSDINDSDSLWYRSLNAIRWRHAMATRMCQQHGLVGIRQKDMAITQFGFIGHVLLCPELIASTNKLEEREAFNHFWRVTGYMLGISDRLNLCRKTELETTQLCMRVSREIIKVEMEAPSPELTRLLKNTLDGLWYIDHTMDPDAVLAFTYKMEGAEWKKPLSLYSRCNTQYAKAIVNSMSLPYLGAVLRILYNNIYMISYWALKTCPIAAWLKFGKGKSALHLYPTGS